jgi:hypothetical protein
VWFYPCNYFVCDQDKFFFKHLDSLSDPYRKLDEFISTLIPVEEFYHKLGGLKAYHNEFLWLLKEKTTKKPESNYLLPKPIDITSMSPTINRAIRRTIENQELMAEIYPIGGSGDRFSLTDPKTNEDLPLASLLFQGYSLIEGLMRDLQAKEYLCFKLRGCQLITPIAMMTSHEKKNHERVIKILEKNEWFGRGKENFQIFSQPLVPMISEEGTWVQSEPLTLSMKPGGHGVIWKIAHDQNVFQWFKDKHVTKALVRQINNPIAGTDYGLLAFTGFGIDKNKSFGFASCQRVVNSAEGMNVLIENVFKESGIYEYSLSNIEYTNLEQEGLKDVPVSPDSPYSAYPCNTNILFVDLPTIEKLCLDYPLPGMLINLKLSYPVLQPDGSFKMSKAGRIETTMQNISDYLLYSTNKPLEDHDQLPQFITYNDRLKTISVTKQQYVNGGKIDNTPEGALRDLHTLYRHLLTTYCGFTLPPKESIEHYLTSGPSFYFYYHPALGPLYSIIGHKLKKGILHNNSELVLTISEIEITDLILNGSLLVEAKIPCGHNMKCGTHRYSDHGGKCVLKNVTITNKGINRNKTLHYWKGTPVRHEACSIIIEGNGEFHAEDIELNGSKTYFVPDGHRLVVTKLGETLQAIESPTWYWEYSFGDDDSIQLTKKITISAV